MIHCHLARLMAPEQLRIADVARATGLNRSTVKALKEGRVTRVELPDVEALCRLFGCSVGDLFEYTADAADSGAAGRETPS
jgi:putative transcriptional regulator